MGWPKGKPRKGYVKKAVPVRAAKPQTGPDWKTWKTLLVHKNGPWPKALFCPQCEFPEADGGYCPACGWMRKIGIGKW